MILNSMPSKTPLFDAAIDAILSPLTPHTRTCVETGETFEITQRDIDMFRTLRVPPPQTTWWARLRQKRMFIGGFDFFRRTLPDGTSVVSSYDPESDVHIMRQSDWNADSFDPSKYGQAIDPNKSFFEQRSILSKNVPRPAIIQDPRNENCEYAMYLTGSKNCYYSLTGFSVEDALFSDMCSWVKNIAEGITDTNCEWCYYTVQCNQCSRVHYSELCTDSHNLLFCLGCSNCSDCFGCTNLRNKKFYFLNEQLTEEEYRRRVKEIDLTDANVVEEWKKKIASIWANAFRKSSEIRGSEDAAGDLIENSHHVEGISIFESERVYYGFGMINGGKDDMDFTSSINCELSYGIVRTMRGYENKMTLACEDCMDVEYSELLTACEHCFGCIGLKHQKFCIFNKQYTEGAYWPLVDAIKTAMLARGEYGEFFPHRESPFAYNTSQTITLFPLEETEAKRIGARWYAFKDEISAEATPIEELPMRLADTKDDILKKRFRCPVSGRAFAFVKPELELHRTLGLALPRLHPSIRHKNLATQLLPFQLFVRACDSCKKESKTRISPTHKAPVYCPDCYEAIVIGEKEALKA